MKLMKGSVLLIAAALSLASVSAFASRIGLVQEIVSQSKSGGKTGVSEVAVEKALLNLLKNESVQTKLLQDVKQGDKAFSHKYKAQFEAAIKGLKENGFTSLDVNGIEQTLIQALISNDASKQVASELKLAEQHVRFARMVRSQQVTGSLKSGLADTLITQKDGTDGVAIKELAPIKARSEKDYAKAVTIVKGWKDYVNSVSPEMREIVARKVVRATTAMVRTYEAIGMIIAEIGGCSIEKEPAIARYMDLMVTFEKHVLANPTQDINETACQAIGEFRSDMSDSEVTSARNDFVMKCKFLNLGDKYKADYVCKRKAA